MGVFARRDREAAQARLQAACVARDHAGQRRVAVEGFIGPYRSCRGCHRYEWWLLVPSRWTMLAWCSTLLQEEDHACP